MLVKMHYPIPSHVFDPEKEEVFQEHGDMDHGLIGEYVTRRMSEAYVTLLDPGHPTGEKVHEWELYCAPSTPGDPGEMTLHALCPNCGKDLNISSKRKSMEFNPTTGSISVEPMECTWELDTKSPANKGLGITNLCRCRFFIERNVIRRL